MDPEPTQRPDGKFEWPRDENIDRLCSLDGAGAFRCPAEATCGHPFQFESKRVSLETEGVSDDSGSNYGIATLDNVILGFVTVFQFYHCNNSFWIITDFQEKGSSQTPSIERPFLLGPVDARMHGLANRQALPPQCLLLLLLLG